MLDKITRPSVLEVNLDNFKYNIEQIRKLLKAETKIMPVIKSEAYGTYINTRLDIINKFAGKPQYKKRNDAIDSENASILGRISGYCLS